MQRIPDAEFPPALKQRLEELWGKPPNLYRALGTSDGSPRSRAISPGFFSSSHMPLPSRLVVVSCPAFSRKMHWW